jgi:predicted amidohydrolase YtcJ
MKSCGALSLRITKGIPEDFLEQALATGLKSGEGDDWVKIGWLKLFADGALGTQTAAMLSPYENTEDRGMLLLDEAAILRYGEKALPAGIALAVHAIGDRANRTVLSALRTLQQEGTLAIPVIPSRIEHCQIISIEDSPLFRKHNVTASMQPIHAVSDAQMAQAYWGDRCQTAYAWRSLLDHGAHLIFGSDAPVESPNPLYGIAAALSRRRMPAHTDALNESWIARQCIHLNDALKAYCHTPPMVSGYSASLGELEPGKFADLVLLPCDFLNQTPDILHETKPTATMVGGNWVYKNDKIDIELA